MVAVKPILTEKRMAQAKGRLYTFLVGRDMDKNKIKNTVEAIYEVHVTDVRTIKIKGGFKKNIRGQKVRIPALKKAIVALKGDEKIDVFEEKKK